MIIINFFIKLRTKLEYLQVFFRDTSLIENFCMRLEMIAYALPHLNNSINQIRKQYSSQEQEKKGFWESKKSNIIYQSFHKGFPDYLQSIEEVCQRYFEKKNEILVDRRTLK